MAPHVIEVMYYIHGIPWHFLLRFDLRGTRCTKIHYRLRRHVIVTRLFARAFLSCMAVGYVMGVTGGRLSKARAPRVVFSWIIVARILE